MMNVNELFRTVNIEARLAEVEACSGTFQETWTDQDIAPSTWSKGVFIERGTDNVPRLRFK